MARGLQIVGLDGGAPANEAARVALATRVGEVGALRAAALNWTEAEGIHDLRVATRRLRGTLQDFRPYLSKREARLIGKGLKPLLLTLGEVRDADVTIAALEKLHTVAPHEVGEGIAYQLDARRWRREAARARLEELLEESTLASWQEEVVNGLRAHSESKLSEIDAESLDAPVEHDHEAAPTFRAAGRKILARRIKQLERGGLSLYTPHKPGPLHDLRLDAKRLRYALELLSPCWEGKLNAYADEVAGLQTALGELHDCDVWIESLGQTLRAAHDERHASKDSLTLSVNARDNERRAALWLLRHFAKERTRHYRAALARWHAWENFRLLAHLHSLITASDEPPAHNQAQL